MMQCACNSGTGRLLQHVAAALFDALDRIGPVRLVASRPWRERDLACAPVRRLSTRSHGFARIVRRGGSSLSLHAAIS